MSAVPDILQREQSLCPRCASLDIGEVLARHRSTPFDEELPIWSWNDYEDPDWLKPNCALCRLIGIIKIPHDTSQAGLWYFTPPEYLYILPKDEASPPIPLGLQKVVRRHTVNDGASWKVWRDPAGRTWRTWTLFLASRGSVQSQGSLIVRKINPSRINFDLVKGWLAADPTPPSSTYPVKGPQIIPSNLIDCATETVVSANGQDYLALSYVWGKTLPDDDEASSPHGEAPSDKLPEQLPATVSDAIAATTQLGYRYLWVDKYCIDQNDDISKLHQIQNMDIIFKRASVTLVAAAGSDADFGLPGIGPRSRESQPVACLTDDYELAVVSATSVVQEAISQSKWDSRAWTYQEARLASRLLVFTSREVYYESRAGNRRETVESPFACMDENLFISQKPFFDPWNANNPEFVNEAIAEFSARDLSRQEDALLAALGFLKEFRNGPNPVYHHWGVPIFPDQAIRLGHGRTRFPYLGPKAHQPFSHEGFLLGLCWRPAGDRLLGPEGMRLQRRPKLPTWSWAGWSCPLDPKPQSVYEIEQFHPHADDKVFLELDNGDVVPLRNLYEYRHSGKNSATRRPFSSFIRLDVNTVPLQLTDVSPEDVTESMQDQYTEPFALKCDDLDFPFCYGGWGSRTDSFISLIPLEELQRLLAESPPSLSPAPGTPQQLIGAIMGRFEDKKDWPYGKQFILVLCRGKDGTYQRIGHISQGDKRVGLDARTVLEKNATRQRLRIG